MVFRRIVYEITYVLGLILTISVIGSASGKLTHELSGLPEIVGTIVMMGLVGFFVFYGSALIIKVLSVWSFLLYAVYIVLALACWLDFGDTIKDMVILYKEDSQWFLGGVKYAAYNLGGIPAILFSIRYIRVGEKHLSPAPSREPSVWCRPSSSIRPYSANIRRSYLK